jgi:tRNA threonylcarbamoyladenosine biosynthesis protein TsaE
LPSEPAAKALAALRLHLPDEAATARLGASLARSLAPNQNSNTAAHKHGLHIQLQGELGAGKTSLVRALLRALGVTGHIKSPTYTLVEPYAISGICLYHFDFYRFLDPQELEESGFREYFNPQSVCLIEWPEKAPDLPPADLDFELHAIDQGRSMAITAHTEAGRRCLDKLKN